MELPRPSTGVDDIRSASGADGSVTVQPERNQTGGKTDGLSEMGKPFRLGPSEMP